MSLRHSVGVLPSVGAAVHVHGALPVAGLNEVPLGGLRVALLLIVRKLQASTTRKKGVLEKSS